MVPVFPYFHHPAYPAVARGKFDFKSFGIPGAFLQCNFGGGPVDVCPCFVREVVLFLPVVLDGLLLEDFMHSFLVEVGVDFSSDGERPLRLGQ